MSGCIKYLSNLFEQFRTATPLTKIAGVAAGCALFVTTRRLYLSLRERILRLPPSIPGFVYFGSLFTIAYLKQDFGLKLLPKYGPICSYNVGNTTFIAINDANLMQAMFKSRYLINRPKNIDTISDSTDFDNNNHVDMIKSKRSLVICNENEDWLARRKLILKSIIAMANSNYMEKQIKYLLIDNVFDVLDNYCTNDHDDGNKKWYCTDDINNISFNLIFGALFGSQYNLSKNNKEYKYYCKLLIEMNDIFALSILFNSLSIATISSIFGINKKMKQLHDDMNLWFAEYVNKAIESFSIKNQTKNSVYINNNQEQEQEQEQEKTFFDQIYEEIIQHNSSYDYYIKNRYLLSTDIAILVSAAKDTSSLSIETFILYLAKDIQLQNEIYKELIDHATKDEKNKYFINLNAITNKCAKFRAFVHEGLRITNPLVRGFPKALTKTCKLSFNIDKNGKCCDIEMFPLQKLKFLNQNTDNINKKYNYILSDEYIIEANLDYINCKDSKFNIYNWIKTDSNGKLLFENNVNSMPFSYGMRDCVGKMFAIKQLYLLMANLLLNYQFVAVDQERKIKFKVTHIKIVYPQLPVYVKHRSISYP